MNNDRIVSILKRGEVMNGSSKPGGISDSNAASDGARKVTPSTIYNEYKIN
jgi:hypothetical protein